MNTFKPSKRGYRPSIHIRLEADVWERLKLVAKEVGISQHEVIDQALRFAFDSMEDTKKNLVTLEHENGVWLARFEYDVNTKDYVKSLGFWWSPKLHSWYTEKAEIAAKIDPTIIVKGA